MATWSSSERLSTTERTERTTANGSSTTIHRSPPPTPIHYRDPAPHPEYQYHPRQNPQDNNFGAVVQILNKPESTNKPTVTIIEPAQLSTAEQVLLTRGLSFVPTKQINNNLIMNDLDNFHETLIQRALPYPVDIPKHPFIPTKTHHLSSSLSVIYP